MLPNPPLISHGRHCRSKKDVSGIAERPKVKGTLPDLLGVSRLDLSDSTKPGTSNLPVHDGASHHCYRQHCHRNFNGCGGRLPAGVEVRQDTITLLYRRCLAIRMARAGRNESTTSAMCAPYHKCAHKASVGWRWVVAVVSSFFVGFLRLAPLLLHRNGTTRRPCIAQKPDFKGARPLELLRC